MGLRLFGPYLFLRLYVYLTNIFDEIWTRLYRICHRPLMQKINKAIAVLIGITLTQCPRKTMVNVCPNENVTFWLYTNNSVDPYQLKENDPSSLINAPFNYDVPVKILIHGYTGHKNHDPNPQIRPNYIAIGYNVISVDYGAVARKPCYFQAVDNARIVGQCVGNFLDVLLTHNKNLDINWFHVIAFSLGAHVAVYAGVHLLDRNKQLERLTVLDAAAPLFYLKRNFTVMQCAKFIDAIHTNAGLYGKSLRVAHVDFYVNYLLFQRGCGILDVSCNHLKAPIYFGESITSKVGFWGYPLNEYENLQLMGEYTPSNARGMYYLSTNSKRPYATGLSFPTSLERLRRLTLAKLGPLLEFISWLIKIPIKHYITLIINKIFKF